MAGETAIRHFTPLYRLIQMTRCRTALFGGVIAAAEWDAVERVGSLETIVARPAKRRNYTGKVGELELCLCPECASHEHDIPNSVHMPGFVGNNPGKRVRMALHAAERCRLRCRHLAGDRNRGGMATGTADGS